MQKSNRLKTLAVLALCAASTPALAESPAADWRQSVFLNSLGATVDGDVQVGPLQVPLVAESVSVSCKPSKDRS